MRAYVVCKLENTLRGFKEKNLNPYTLKFRDSATELEYIHFVLVDCFAAQLLFMIVTVVSAALFAAADVLYYVSKEDLGAFIYLISTRVCFIFAPSLALLIAILLFRRWKSKRYWILLWGSVITTSSIIAGFIWHDVIRSAGALGFNTLLFFFGVDGPLTVVGLLPFLHAVAVNILGLVLFNAIESWQSYSNTDYLFTANLVWISTIANGFLAVYFVDMEMRSKYYLLRKLVADRWPGLNKAERMNSSAVKSCWEDQPMTLDEPDFYDKVKKCKFIWTSGIEKRKIIGWFRDPKLERNFQIRCNMEYLWPMRLFCIMEIIIQLTTTIQDWLLYPNKILMLVASRLALVLACISFFCVTLKKILWPYYHFCSIIFILLFAGAALFAIVIIDDIDPLKHRPYFTSLLRLVIFSFGVLRLQTVFTALTVLVVLVASCITLLLYGYPASKMTSDLLYALTFFFVGLIFSQYREHGMREKYLLSFTLENSVIELAAASPSPNSLP
ncbi:hypothetical protein Pelo_6688 [Pelomyxa schiedti]|nr:hypothetical protein Pelo_6688 [Pelomyxa schiedti]